MCGVIPMLASGKVSPGAVAAGSLGGLAGLAIQQANKKKKPADPAPASSQFYGNTASGT